MSCVKVEVAVLGSLSLTVRAMSVDVKHDLKKKAGLNSVCLCAPNLQLE